MNLSQNSNYENLKPHQKVVLNDLWDEDDKEIMLKIFELRNLRIHNKYILDVLAGFQAFMIHEQNNFNRIIQSNYNIMANDLTIPSIANALKFVNARMVRLRIKEEYPMGGRKSRIKQILEKLTQYPAFSESFYDICGEIERKFHRSTIMKALKHLIAGGENYD